MKTRTQTDPKYGETNRIAMRRVNFYHSCAWQWVQENHPEVADKIKKEAYKKWPGKPKTTFDIGFLEK